MDKVEWNMRGHQYNDVVALKLLKLLASFEIFIKNSVEIEFEDGKIVRAEMYL